MIMTIRTVGKDRAITSVRLSDMHNPYTSSVRSNVDNSKGRLVPEQAVLIMAPLLQQEMDKVDI
jgi:hypothetical protein